MKAFRSHRARRADRARRLFGWSLCALALCLLAGCGENKQTAEGGARLKLVIYTSHGAEHTRPCLERFRKAHPEIEVLSPVDRGATEIAAKIRAEAANPQCDIWWGGPHYDFIEAEQRGLLQPYRPSWAATSLPERHSPTDSWYAQFITPEIIMYNTAKLTPEQAPQEWDDLIRPEWKGKIVLRNPPPSGTMKAIFAAMIWRAAGNRVDGPSEPGFEWLRKLDANTAHYASDPDEMYKYLKSADTPVTVWNMADVYIQRDTAQYPFGMIVPASGVPVLLEGLAIVKGAPHAEAAKIFYEFITSPEELSFQARSFSRIPARTDLPRESLPAWMTEREIKALPIDWVALAPKAKEWMDRWTRTIQTPK